MDWKKFCIKILFPHAAILALLIPVATVFLVYSLLFYESDDIVSVISYVIAFYTLVVLCCRIPAIWSSLTRVKKENKFAVRYSSDARLRVSISLYGSFVFNSAYAIFQLCLGLWHSSVWFYAMAIYYIVLAIMRFFLLNYTRRHKPGEKMEAELLGHRLCGVCLLVMNVALSVIISYIVLQSRVFVHHEITTIAIATYSFTSLTMAIVNICKYKKYNSPIFSASKIITLVAAVVSFLAMESAMLTAFGSESTDEFKLLMLGLTGAVIMIFVITVAIYMIVNSSKKINELRSSYKR